MSEKFFKNQLTNRKIQRATLLSKFTNEDGWQFTNIDTLTFVNSATWPELLISVLDGIYGIVLENQDDPSITYEVGDRNDVLVRNSKGDLTIIPQGKVDKILQ